MAVTRSRLGKLGLSLATLLAIVALLLGAYHITHAAGSAFVRVNQLGYATGAAKRAYLMASSAETGAMFSVKNAGGTTVYSAPLGTSLGSWSNGYGNIYALGFYSGPASGMYTIEVSGLIAGSSPSFKTDTATNLYAGAVANALSFYQNERDGPNYIPSALRTAPAHLNDQSAMTYLTPNMNTNGRFSGDLTPIGSPPIVINASGGWWDAGDYLKFVQTTSYTVDIM